MTNSINLQDLPFPTRLTAWMARVWPWTRGRGRLIRAFRRQLQGSPPFLVTQLKDSALVLELPWQDETALTLALFGEHDAHIGSHERTTLETAISLVKKTVGKTVVLDIGANLGAFAWSIIENTEAGVIAYEPQTDLGKLLQSNTARNGLDARLTVRPIGLSDFDGSSGFEVSASNTGVGHLSSQPETSMSVPVRRLDSEFDPTRWQQVGLIKADVESYELEVFRGAGELWKHHRPIIIFEIFINLLRERNRQPMEVIEYLRSQGYVEFLAIDEYLHPVSTGVYALSNILALAPEHLALLETLPVRRDFRPLSTHVNPVVKFAL